MALGAGMKVSGSMPELAQLATGTIPSTGEKLARIGLGTWRTFAASGDAARQARLAQVLRVYADAGATMVDTSPMYGSAEAVLGELLEETGLRSKFFVATKVWTTGRDAGRQQMENSLRLLRSQKIELMQIHNLLDWKTQLQTLREWQSQGRVRHIGITHYSAGAIDDLARVIRAEKVDFVQYALSLEEPAAAGDFLKLCTDRGVAFIANRPFGEGGALSRVREKPLPAWAREAGIASWAQYLLRWILSHPEVTCAIPATSNPEHARDNLEAAKGAPLDARLRDRLANHWRSL
jgi:diketogulonate reductase-like aldo/keto reductase